MRALVAILAAVLGLAVAAPGIAAKAPAAAAAVTTAYAARADALIRNHAEAGRFDGAVLVAKDGKPIFRKAYGQANREWAIPATPETVYRLGSITKQFTAAAILQLADQGKLKLDDPISRYYPAAPESWAPITVKHLLTHRSGIPSYTALPGFFGNPSRQDMKPEAIVALTQDKPLEFTPGSKISYNNTGYVLLGVVIEKASSQTYAAYLQQHIFSPLGMKNTGFDVSETILPKRAAGYERRGSAVTNAAYLSMTLPHAAGSLYSTVDDILAWDVALRAGRSSARPRWPRCSPTTATDTATARASAAAASAATGAILAASTGSRPSWAATPTIISRSSSWPTSRARIRRASPTGWASSTSTLRVRPARPRRRPRPNSTAMSAATR